MDPPISDKLVATIEKGNESGFKRMFLGSHITTLIFVEIQECVSDSHELSLDNEYAVNAFAKRLLMGLGILTTSDWELSCNDSDGSSTNPPSRANLGIIYIPTLHPLDFDSRPYHVMGYGYPLNKSHQQCVVTETTLIRIIPRQEEKRYSAFVSGEMPLRPLDLDLQDDLRLSYCSDVLPELKHRMESLLSIPIAIGTTEKAFEYRKQNQRRLYQLKNQVLAYQSSNKPAVSSPNTSSNCRTFSQEAAITVHSPHHGGSKTLLVRLIAEELKCCVYRIEAAALIAQYGIYADSALETLVHSIAMSGAVRGQRICILFDPLMSFFPSYGDNPTMLPILNSMASYLNGLVKNIQCHQQLPFPTKNPFYQINVESSYGYTLSVRLCLVGVQTCSLKQSRQITNLHKDAISNALSWGSRYRVPDFTLDEKMIIRCFAWDEDNPSRKEQELVCPQAVQFLITQFHTRKLLARDLSLIRKLWREQNRLNPKIENDLSIDRVKVLFFQALKGSIPPSQYEILLPDLSSKQHRSTDQNSLEDMFSSVGGNMEAKLALRDALAIDPSKQKILQRFGMSPPSGVLLYGPPGTGKTMLARAVAMQLARPLHEGSGEGGTSIGMGGTFLELHASDIVRSEVGNSEKRVVAAFATARARAPSVIFIDEFQALFMSRSSHSGSRSSSSSSLASTLLQCMDDIYTWEQSDQIIAPNSNNISRRIVVMGATNTPWMIDKAFLRSGRFDKVVHVGLPDQRDRQSILMVHIQRMRLQNNPTWDYHQLCEALSYQTEGFSGADLAALCRSAAVRCLNEYGDRGMLEEVHFHHALKYDCTASTNKRLVERLSNWKP